MIDPTAVESYNQRLTQSLSDMRSLTPSQRDRVKQHGSRAEALLKNPDMAMFIHQHKFDIMDQLSMISAHDPDSNARRIALSNQLVGIDAFVAGLQRAVYLKNRAVSEQEGPAEPRAATKEVYQP